MQNGQNVCRLVQVVCFGYEVSRKFGPIIWLYSYGLLFSHSFLCSGLLGGFRRCILLVNLSVSRLFVLVLLGLVYQIRVKLLPGHRMFTWSCLCCGLCHKDIHFGLSRVEPQLLGVCVEPLTIVITYMMCNYNNYIFSYYKIFRIFENILEYFMIIFIIINI